MDLDFSDVSFAARRWGRFGPRKQILNGVSGRFKSGELTAIMGPSGAGKSSLLNAISGYTSTGVTGRLGVNGEPRDDRLFHKLSCYITQDDLLQPLLTVREAMLVSAHLKLPRRLAHQQKMREITEILTMLGMAESLDTRTEMLSGGQKKRLSVALEMINNPPTFFLDEPTSGLDNVSAKYCLGMLRMLSRQGRTVVCTVHQPSALLFQLFDSVYVVAEGRCVYQGTTQGLVSFLAAAGMTCPTHYNPADYVIELCDSSPQNVEALSAAICNGKKFWRGEDLVAECVGADRTPPPSGAARAVQAGDSSSESSFGQLNLSANPGYRKFSDLKNVKFQTSIWTQVVTLFCRMMRQVFRNKVALQLQLWNHILNAAIIGTVFFQAANDGSQMFMHMKLCIAVILFHSYTWLMTSVLLFPQDVKLMKKEYFNRWYGLTAYYLALTLSKIPGQVFFSMIFISMLYFLTGLPFQLLRFTLFSVIGITVSMTSDGLGMAIGSIFNVTNGSAVGPSLIAPFLGLAIYGFDFARSIPTWMGVLMRTSFMRCGAVALVLTVFGMDRKLLDCDEVYCHYRNPKTILQTVNIDQVPLWSEMLCLLGLAAFFRLVLYVGLRRRIAT
ncbi:ATP-binding cassette subfamily G member 4 [Bacillus rossius redtenbacheri]|uniref:ATP-binding cassette subfamily G member 4 n=1 Tax=Bacillus rossius redtenbacheri TaxID=93214 RepID=UPI002FDED7C0